MNSLEDHGFREARKQLSHRMKSSGLDTINVEVTRVSGLPYWEYLKSAKTWDAKVFHSTRETPPPLLSSLAIPGTLRGDEGDD